MPRYLFHLVSKQRVVRDDDGAILDGLKAAHLHALRLVRETLPVLGEDDRRQWRIEIADERQSTLLTVLFSGAAPLAARTNRGLEVVTYSRIEDARSGSP